MTRDGKFLLMNLLSDGQGKVIPLTIIAALLVRRNGIMDLCCDTVISKVLLEFVTTGAENGEDMIHRVVIGENYSHEGIAYFSFVASGNLLAALVVGIKMRELGKEDSGLKLVDAAVAAKVIEDVLA